MISCAQTRFLSTLSLRRATTTANEALQKVKISIHALLAESDSTLYPLQGRNRNFYPRSPCGERPLGAVTSPSVSRFLSTLSLRRATARSMCRGCPAAYFYPRSPCGERPKSPADSGPCIRYFYPRSPCGERLKLLLQSMRVRLFLSTLSLRRATAIILLISKQCRHFYPRSPCGERPDKDADWVRVYVFLSTLSLRRATIVLLILPTRKPDFYPRSPCGERRRGAGSLLS